MSVFKERKGEKSLPPQVKDFMIERIKKGYSRIKIMRDVEKLFNRKISSSTVVRVRKQYIKITGEYLKSYIEFHNLNYSGLKRSEKE